MTRRLLHSIVLTGVTVLLTAVTVAGQAPRTPWGDPDLQGAGTNTVRVQVQVW